MRVPNKLPFAFVPRAVPLTPSALVARGEAADRLAGRLARRGAVELRGLMGLHFPQGFVLLGACEQLPWEDGVGYLGVDPRAPRLLLPTTLEPDVPIDLLEERLIALVSPHAPPVALLPAERTVLPVGAARALTAEALRTWLEARPR